MKLILFQGQRVGIRFYNDLEVYRIQKGCKNIIFGITNNKSNKIRNKGSN